MELREVNLHVLHGGEGEGGCVGGLHEVLIDCVCDASKVGQVLLCTVHLLQPLLKFPRAGDLLHHTAVVLSEPHSDVNFPFMHFQAINFTRC